MVELAFPSGKTWQTTAFLAALLAAVWPARAQEAPPTFKVMAWNILHGGRDIDHGLDHVIDIIRAEDPDLVLMVETYGSGPSIAEALGYHFHLVAPEGTPPDDKSINLSLFSRFPFGERIDTGHPFYLGGREVFIRGQPVRFLSAWFHYDPWEDEPHRMGLDADELLAWEKSGKKWEMVQTLLPILERLAGEADRIPLIIGGDMNAPSHLDWDERTLHLHNNLVVPWQVSRTLEALGLVDAYREVHPDPLRHPGITWDNPDRADEHRIDYIHYKGKELRATEAAARQAFLGDTLHLGPHAYPYPSDHGFVVVTFELSFTP